MSVPSGPPPPVAPPVGGDAPAPGDDLDSCGSCKFYVPAGDADGGECTAMGDTSVKPDTFVQFPGKRPRIIVFSEGYCSDFVAADETAGGV